jgi:hypothetical protein
MKNLIELKLGDDNEVGYVYLPEHPRNTNAKCVNKTVDIRDLINDYKGPELLFDFDESDTFIGIEILG